MKRLIIVYNSRSTQYARVQKEVIARARGLGGWQVGKYEVKPTDVDKNAEALARILMDGDLVLAAGGDATATIALNGCLLSEKKVSYAALPYGNFCDAARVCGFKNIEEIAEANVYARRGGVVEMWPLEVLVDGQHWRYMLEYVTVGLFAEATAIFDEEKVRAGLKKRRRTKVFSWVALAKWYFKNRKGRDFVPRMRLNGELMDADVTDYVAMNGPRMASVMRGENMTLEKKEFCSGVAGLKKFSSLFVLMARSILWRAPVMRTKGDVLKFLEPGRVMIQAVGEYAEIEVKKQIEVRKARKSIMVMRKVK